MFLTLDFEIGAVGVADCETVYELPEEAQELNAILEKLIKIKPFKLISEANGITLYLSEKQKQVLADDIFDYIEFKTSKLFDKSEYYNPKED